MASEKQANAARDKYADMLRTRGAHAIGVDQVDGSSSNNFAVIAFVQNAGAAIPESLTVQSGDSTIRVPVIKKIAETFKPE